MSDPLSEQALRSALVEYCKEMISNLPSPEELEQNLPFSTRFEKKMQKLICDQRKSYWQLINTVGKRVAVALLVFALSASCLMSVEAIRIPIIEFIVEIYETFTRISTTELEETGAPEQIEQVYEPQFIPQGFTLAEKVQEESFAVLYYSKGAESFDWNQFCVNVAYHIDTEGVAMEELDHRGVHYWYYSNKGVQNFIWKDKGYSFLCSGTLQKEDLFAIVCGGEK